MLVENKEKLQTLMKAIDIHRESIAMSNHNVHNSHNNQSNDPWSQNSFSENNMMDIDQDGQNNMSYLNGNNFDDNNPDIASKEDVKMSELVTNDTSNNSSNKPLQSNDSSNKPLPTNNEFATLKKLNQKVNKVNDLIDQIQGILSDETLHQLEVTTSKQIDDHFAAIEQQLKKRKQELKNKLRQTIKTKRNVLKEQMDNLKANKVVLNQHQTLCASTLRDTEISQYERSRTLINYTQQLLHQSGSVTLREEPNVIFKESKLRPVKP